MMGAVHIERLRTLYAMIAGIPKERIELETWRSRLVKPYDPDWSKEVTNKDLLSQDCGTLACAVGWACAHPEFQKQGLRWDVSPVYRCVDGECRFGWDAVESFFGIHYSLAKFLFSVENIPYSDVGTRAALYNEYPPVKRGDAKRTLLKRIRTHLLHIGAITPERNRELARLESTGKLTP